MDEFDIAILNRVQQNCRLTAEQLSKEVGLSPSACQRRLTKLRETGIIEREISVIAPETVGRRLTMVVQVTLEREHPNVVFPPLPPRGDLDLEDIKAATYFFS